jgi:hypothetical protein
MRTSCGAALLALFLAGCGEPSPVDWDAEQRIAAVIAPGARLVISESGKPAIVQGWTPLKWPEDSTACANTHVGARARGDTAYAAWWHLNAYGYADLMLARSDDGIRWNAPEIMGGAVGTERACSRPLPAIAVDSTTGAVYLAWHGMSQWGPGMLFAEVPTKGRAPFAVRIDSMEPVMRVASVAAFRDTVAVLWEASSEEGSELRLAISMRAGHIPMARATVRSRDTRVFAPLVSVRDGRVAMAWNEARRGDAPPSAAARVGRILK